MTPNEIEGVDITPELPIDIPVEQPIKGIHKWENPINGFNVYRLAAEAHPEKGTPEYFEEARKGFPTFLDYLREYHLVWRAFSGKPVYFEDWNKQYHSTKETLSYNPNLPIARGWDFGLTPACVFAQLVEGMRLHVLSEVCEDGMGIEKFLEIIQVHTQKHFPNARAFIDICDPSGFYRKDTDERSCVSVMSSDPYYIRPIPGVQNPTARRNSVVKFLQRTIKGEPGFKISEKDCPTLVKGFDGGFHFSKNRNGQWRDMWEKNEYSHPHEALQYVCTRVIDISLNRTDGNPLVIQRQTYGGFGGGNTQRPKQTTVWL